MSQALRDALGIISGSVDLKEFSDYRLNFEGVKRILAKLRATQGGGEVELPGSWLDALLLDVNSTYDTTHASSMSQDRRRIPLASDCKQACAAPGSRAACRAGIKIRTEGAGKLDLLSPSILREKILDVMSASVTLLVV
eukprot:s3224_g6.t1